MTFEDYWAKAWKPTGQPAVFDAAMREIAEKAWVAAQAESEKYKKLADAVDEGRASILVENADDSIDGGVIYTTVDDALDSIDAALGE